MPGPESLQPSDPTSFGEYSVIGRLGRGGQGIVYLARDSEGQKYAVKVLNEQWSQDTDLRKRFEKEVRAAQKVASFCTAAIHEANLDADPPYVVSEYVEGPDLQEAVSKEGPRKGAALQRLAVSTATALVAIHQAGIVHRDFKPGNVLLGRDGPRVIDFGIARVTDSTATVTNSIVGTPSYMAPEQIAGKNITDKVDVFAWGCVMAFASTGNAPFGSDSVPAVVHRVVSAPPDISEVPEPLRTIVADCLNKDPDQRPTAKQLLMRLLGHDAEDEEKVPTSQAVAEGEKQAIAPVAPSGPQRPLYPNHPPTPSGPQTPFPGPPAPPHTGPQQPTTGYNRPAPPMPNPNVTGAVHPNMTAGLPPTMSQRPPIGGQGYTPVQPQSQQSDDPVLAQGWVLPAVIVVIIVLLLILLLMAVAQ
ncbi:serine/threonine-protein kinase [Thermobifida cellulosilytica]|uniref:Serine/threonine protein kinase n=1 Tax=Thermobifida cellulosilytica TB100 TaxID=665004 RepID=A0A147KCX3_THECS|nr:serine/threonine-protein kinase [Thermobifida cellulosilytica]KUP95151.1 serine/threonine protein kinase [Thermobifida cellulosilytica TB100]